MFIFLKKNLTNIIFFSFLLFLIVSRYPTWKAATQLEGARMPEIQVLTMDQKSISFPQQMKTPAVVVFWATWCGPCQIELARYQKAVENKELPADQLYLISSHEEVSLVQEVMKKRKYPFLSFLDPDGKAALQLGVRATPTVVLIDNAGKVNWIGVGISPLGIQRAKALIAKQ